MRGGGRLPKAPTLLVKLHPFPSYRGPGGKFGGWAGESRQVSVICRQPHAPAVHTARDYGEGDRVEAAVDAIFEAALKFGGTLSGEHGIGAAKCRFMEQEVGRGAILYSKRIKAALDPKNILKTGKSIGEVSAVSP